MEKSSNEPYQTDCPLAHDLINKLSIIVGNCDLLVERIPESSPLWNRMLLVRDLAKSVGEELGRLQCDLARVRTVADNKASTASHA
jgi:nitrogen-specific signal transduction histidine kinase